MRSFILIPDSFKGTMDSLTVCRIMEEAIRGRYPEAEVLSFPVADGGEGTVDAFLHALGGDRVEVEVKGPFFEEVDSFYGLVDRGQTAIIEMAAASGLPLAGDRKDPSSTTTYGVGQLILDAAGRGAKKIILGLGGSATNDGGCGMAAALGFRFLDEDGHAFVPTGGTLKDIYRIDSSGRSPFLQGLDILAMCDIDNPLHGPGGAAHVFAPQKGAGPEAVLDLDAGLVHLDQKIQEGLGLFVADHEGAGAAGGMGAGALAFLDARLKAGIDLVLDTLQFEDKARGADLILTGEGKIDAQSLGGKVVVGVARRAKALGVPVVAIVGDIEDPVEAVYQEGVAGIFSINRLAIDFDQAKKRSEKDLFLTLDNLLRFLRSLEEGAGQVL